MRRKELSRGFCILALTIVIVASILAFGCAERAPSILTAPGAPPASATTTLPASIPTSATTTEPTPSLEPQYGGVLLVIDRGAIRGIGWPVDSSPYDIRQNTPCLEALWHIDPDGTLKPELAVSWDIESGWKSVTFHLRKGVKFHDGTDWNAEAAKYTLNVWKEAKKDGTNAWSSIDVIDEYTLRLTLSTFLNIQRQVIGDVKFVSPTAVEKNGIDWARWHPVGTGPFKFVKFERDVTVEYEKFDGYWEKGKPYLDGIKFLLIADDLTQTNTMAAGQAHALLIASSKFTSDLRNMGFTVDYLNHLTFGLIIDSANPTSPFKDKKVREAVDYCFDREAICKVVGFGEWAPAYQFAPATCYGYNPNIKAREYDPEKARQLLAAAGYPDGFKTKLIGDTRASREILSAYQSYLNDIGIEVEVVQTTTAATTEMGMKGWDGLMWQVLGQSQTDYLYTTYNSLRSGRTQNISTQTPAGLDELFNKALAAEDLETRNQLTREITNLLYEDVTNFPIYMGGPAPVYAKGVHEVNLHQPLTNFWWNARGAWLEKGVR